MYDILKINDSEHECKRFSDLWDCQKECSEHWVRKVQILNQKLFTKQNNLYNTTADVVADLSEFFDEMSDDVDDSNRRSYCKALLNYCEFTQDWRDWGNWTEEEIKIGVGEDGSWLYYGLGRYFEETGQYQKSIEYHQTGIEDSKDAGDDFFLALNYLGAGIAMQRCDRRIEKSETPLLKALKLFKKQNNLYQEANTLANLGSCYDRFDKNRQAISCYQESELILRRIGNYFDLGRILYSLGIAYLRNNQLSEAESAFSDGKTLCETTKNLYYLALNFYGMGWLKYKKGKYKDARHLLEESIRRFQRASESNLGLTQLSFPEVEGNIYLLAGAVYIKGSEPDFQAAKQYLKQAEDAYHQLDNAEEKLLNVLANRARVYECSENWLAATNTFLELLEAGKNCKSTKIAGDATIHLFCIYIRKSASFYEWIQLIKNLGLLGIWSLIREGSKRLKHKIGR